MATLGALAAMAEVRLGVRPRHLRSIPRAVRPVYGVHMLLSKHGKQLE